MAQKKTKLLYLAKYFMIMTDEKHTVTINEIIKYLEKYDINVDRRTLYNDIELLRDFGMDIDYTITKTYNYYLASREFELAEVKTLIDIVQASPAISQKKSISLINKLETLTCSYNASELNRQVYVFNRAKNYNEKLFYHIDSIHNAIASNKKIKFKYFDLDIRGKKIYRKNGVYYTTNPIALTVDNFYYLITYSRKYRKYIHYRVDRMSDVEIVDKIREKPKETFDLTNYVRKIFNMYTGEVTTIKLEVNKNAIGVFLDKFGDKMYAYPINKELYSVAVEVSISPTFFAWLFGLGVNVKITAPETVIQDFIEFGKENIKRYEK